MPRKNIVLDSTTDRILVKMGARIRRARLRRNISAVELAKQAGLSETTFYSIEKGTSTVSIGAYAAVLAVLRLDNDMELIALDEEGKKKFQECSFKKRERASRK